MSKSAAVNAETPKEGAGADRAEEQDGEGGVWAALRKTLRHFLPDFDSWMKAMPDPRDPRFIVYPIDYVLSTGLLMFLTKLGSRRQIRYQFGTSGFIRNLNSLCGTRCESMLHPDTLAYLMKRLSPRALEDLRHAILYTLIRKRVFDGDRLLGKFFRVAIDGTGTLAFKERHCEHCLTQKHENATFYYHPVLEAKLVTGSGLSLSMATEFIENPEPDMDKQDCEQRAFVRLAKRLKQDYPQLSICVLLDGLYAGGPTFDLCRHYGWSFIITFKEGSASAVFLDYEQLKAAGAQPHPQVHEERRQTFWWVNGVDFSGRSVNVLECREEPPQGAPHRFVWVTDIPVSEANFAELGNGGGRLRWKIENEGFNIQKNNGYELEHAYSEHPQAAKNFYLLLQIAHLISQLLEKGLLAKHMTRRIGAVRNVARFLLEELRHIVLGADQLNRIFQRRIQIRFADSS